MVVWIMKMLQYERIDVLEGIDINKSDKSKECLVFHYWYFRNIAYEFESYVFNECHDISMIAYELKNIPKLNVWGVGYKCILWNITRNDTINSWLRNSKLDDKSTLWISVLVQIKDLSN